MTILIALIMLTAISSVGFCQDTVALMIQQTPPQGGSVSPDVGVHDIAKNNVVTLTATPKPGYKFAYWLGDVGDAASATTVMSLASPKMVIAVFERSDFGFAFYEAGPTSAPNENLRGSAEDLVAQTDSAVAGKRGHNYSYSDTPDDEEEDDGFPVPEVPEPVTIILLGLGSAFVSTRKIKR